MNRIVSKIRRTALELLPSRPVEVSIAGESYHIDSRSMLRSPINDYDYAWLRELGKGKRCIIDAGCASGLTALMFARYMDPAGTMVLLDGMPGALKGSAANLLAEGPPAPSIFLLHAWVGAGGEDPSSAPDLIACRPDSGEMAAALARLPEQPRNVSLDEVCARHDLRPDLVKIDIEGAEHDGLAGAARLAAELRPAFQVELHTFRNTMVEGAARIIDWCRRSGYEAWYLKLHVRLEDPQQLSERRRCHVLLLPAGTPYPASLPSIPQGAPEIHSV